MTQGRAVSVVRASSVDFDVLVGRYLVDVSAELAPETVATYQGYFVKNFAPRFGREVELSEVAQALLTLHCDGTGLIWGSFDCRAALRNAARDAGCFTAQEIRHLSLHDLRHGALTELASVSPNLPGIAHLAGHKRVSTTTQYVHSNREQTRAVLNARPAIPVTDLKSTDLCDVAKVLSAGNEKQSEDGGIGRRAGFRLQDQNPNAPLFLRDIRHRLRPEEVSERHQCTHFGHGDRNAKGVVPMDDVRRAAAALLHRVADGVAIPIEVLHGFAELVLRSELVAGSRRVLDGPPELAMRRAAELASVVLTSGVSADLEGEGEGPK